MLIFQRYAILLKRSDCMKGFLSEIKSELILVFTGQSLDVLLPPIIFYISYRFFSLSTALLVAITIGLYFFIHRLRRKENIWYALLGLFGVIFASLLSYMSNNASNFFLPDIILSLSLILLTIVSIIKKRPIAAYVSHITRGWDLQWFYRKDILPAYLEVSYGWLFFFIARLIVEINLYLSQDIALLTISNIILGLPVTILVLTLSYAYGIFRLRQLKGPGIDEFMEGKEAPYRGQIKGF
jgi:hypothetical protein